MSRNYLPVLSLMLSSLRIFPSVSHGFRYLELTFSPELLCLLSSLELVYLLHHQFLRALQEVVWEIFSWHSPAVSKYNSWQMKKLFLVFTTSYSSITITVSCCSTGLFSGLLPTLDCHPVDSTPHFESGRVYSNCVSSFMLHRSQTASEEI